MKLNNIYPKTEEDKIFKNVEEYIKQEYPHVKIKNIRITKIMIFVRTYYGQIILQKCEFI